MWLVCEILDWVLTFGVLIYGFMVLMAPRARIHPVFAFFLYWLFLVFAMNYLFIQFGHVTFGGHDYSAWLPLLCPLFAIVAAVLLPFVPMLEEFTLTVLIVMMIAGWYNFDTTLSVATTSAFIIMLILGFMRITYIIQVFTVAFASAAVVTLSVLGPLLQINRFHDSLNLPPECDNHVNMFLICDIQCSSILNDPSALVHSLWIMAFVMLFIFHLLLVWRMAPDLYDKAQLQSLCWCCACCKCCQHVKIQTGQLATPPSREWFEDKPSLITVQPIHSPGSVGDEDARSPSPRSSGRRAYTQVRREEDQGFAGLVLMPQEDANDDPDDYIHPVDLHGVESL